MITTGFTFRGSHSSVYNIICDPTSRQLLPEKRRITTAIPGRSGSHRQEDGAYNDRSESFTCYFIKQGTESVSDLSRSIAAWLSEPGVLSFDNEPDKFYSAYLTGAPPLAKHLKYGEFSLTFIYSPPFAYTADKQVVKDITLESESITFAVLGTAPTPCRIIIKNNGSSTIENIHIVHSTEEEL